MRFQKGQSGNPKGKPKGTKNRETLIKEERRAIFDEQISKKWKKTIRKLKAEYIADQFMGKAPDELIIKGPIQIDEDIAKKNVITSKPENNSERLA